MKKFGLGIFMIVLLLSIFGCSKKEVEVRYILEGEIFSQEFYIKAKGDAIDELNIDSIYKYTEDGRTKKEMEEIFKDRIVRANRRAQLGSGVKYFLEITDEVLTEKIRVKMNPSPTTESDLIDLELMEPIKGKKTNSKWYLSFKSYKKMLKEIGAKEVK